MDAIGTPYENSQVLVTANYKLTFDTLRKELSGLNLWIMFWTRMVSTSGVLFGKGTFGTKKLINRI